MRINLSVLCGITLVLAVFTVSAGADDEIKWGKITQEEWDVGPPEDYPEANALILFDKAHITVKTDNIEIKYHVRMKALNAEGVEVIGEQSVLYHKEYDKLKRFKAHTITPDGKKHKIKKDAIFEKESDNYKNKTFAFPALEAGAIIEYQYSIISERYRYLKPWYFQNNIYTLKSELSATLYSGFTYNVLYQNVPPQFRSPKVEETPDISQSVGTGAKLMTYTWSREDLPPITDEPYMSAENDYRSSLRFQIVTYEDPYNFIKFQKSWSELGELMQKEFDEYYNKRKDIGKLAQEITAGLNDEREKSKAIYDYVTAEYKTSYEYDSWLFVQEKISGLLSEKRGSGEAKNLLLVEMHNAVGIPAWPVMISTRANSKFNAGFPYLPQFNYTIAYVQLGNQWEFFDTSDKLSPYGVLPPQCLAGGGLLIDGEKSELVRIPVLPITSTRVDKTRMYVSSQGAVICSTECRFTGYYASDFGDSYERKSSEDFVQDYFLEKLDAEYTIDNYQCELDSTNQLCVSVNFTTDDLAKSLDNNLLISPVRYAFKSNPFKSEKRFFPVDFTYPFVYRNWVEIYPDSPVQEYVLPENLTESIEGVTLERRCMRQDSCIVVDLTLTIEQPLILPGRYRQLKSFFDQVAQADADEVTVVLASGE